MESDIVNFKCMSKNTKQYIMSKNVQELETLDMEFMDEIVEYIVFTGFNNSENSGLDGL